MGSYRFLLSRRWASFALVVVLLAAMAWWLGEWQFGRLHDRRANNTIIRTNEARPPVPVEDVLSTDTAVGRADAWRRVEASGTYDADHTVIVRYRSDEDGAPGVDVVVPLVTDSGASLVVDRGFLATQVRSPALGDVPRPPAGRVTVVGWVRVDGTGDSTGIDTGTATEGLSTRAISSDRIGAAIGRPVYGGFVDAVAENDAPVAALTGRQLPELDDGPHFFYGLQWWFFGVLAVFGFFYLAYDERKRGPRGGREQDRTRTVKVAKVKQTNVPAQYQRR